MSDARGTSPRTTRRNFLHQIGVFGVGGLFSLLTGVPLVGFAVDVLFKRSTEQWVRVCSLDQINFDTPTQFRIAFQGENSSVPYSVLHGVFVIRRGEEVLAYSNVCTHMGCSVRWLDWRQQVLCPCHGGMYDRWGQLMGGPPAASLPFYLSRIDGNDLYVANRIIRRGAPSTL